MRKGRVFACLILALLGSACNLSVPQVTLTLAPIHSLTPIATAGIETPSATSQATAIATTPPPSPTRIQPRAATATPIATATDAIAPTLPGSETAAPFTLPPTLPNRRITWTAAPTALPTSRIQTAAPPSRVSRSIGLGSTATPTATPTRFHPTVALRRELIVDTIPPPQIQLNRIDPAAAAVYQYDLGAGFNFAGRAIADAVLFSPNPAAPDSFLLTDARGMLRYKLPGDPAERPLADSPFFIGFDVPSSDANKNRIVEIDWSADGSAFTFRIDPPPGQDSVNAGLWYWQPRRDLATDPTYALIRDCPAPDYASCELVRESNAAHWKTLDAAWSPSPGSNAILLRVDLPAESRSALALAQAQRDAHYANQAPHFARYDFGHWSSGGDEIIVSGRRPDGGVVIAATDHSLTGERLIFDASAAGLWLRDAVRLPDGRVVAFGRASANHDSAPLALYDAAGTRLSAFVGDSAPDSIHWYPDRSAAVLRIGERQFTVQVNGGHISDSAHLTRQPRFGVSGDSPPIPSAVIQGSRYRPGQQLRARVSLNVRALPYQTSQIVGGLFPGDYLAIIAGPYDSEAITWWKAQTASDVIGWVAGEIDGKATIASD